MPEVLVGDIHIHYELSGPEGAPAVCLNHCFTADHGYWDQHMPAFSGYRILRFDARGHGATDATPGPYTLAQMADDAAGLCAALDIHHVHLFGVSLGGQIAQYVALRHPRLTRSLTLINSTCEYTSEQTAMWRARAREALDGGIAAIHAPLMQRWFTPVAAAARTPGYRYMDAMIGRFPPDVFAAASEAMCGLETSTHLASINVPAMVIATPDDPGAPRELSERMARELGGELHWLEPAQHLASLEHPERFNQLVADFLTRIDPV